MKSLDKKMSCPKCGFYPSIQNPWKLEFSDSCRVNSCDWDDSDVKEHIHQICPECAYVVSVKCLDYDKVKKDICWGTEVEEPKTITQLAPVPNVAPQAQPRVISARPNQPVSPTQPLRSSTPYSAPKDPWNTECCGCKVGK